MFSKRDNLKKKGEICTAASWSSASRARCQERALLALQPVLRVCACLCGHGACWHHVRSLSEAKGARFGTIYFMFSACSEPWSKLACQLSLGFLLEQTSVLSEEPGKPWNACTRNKQHLGWAARLLSSPGAPEDRCRVVLLY